MGNFDLLNTRSMVTVLHVICVWLLVLMAGPTIDAAESVSDLKQVIFQIDNQTFFGRSGHITAVAKGFYADEGLEVTVRVGTKDMTGIEAVVSGEAQFASTGSNAMLAYLHGEPVVALAAIYQRTDSTMLMRQDSGISNFSDFIGKTIVLDEREANHEFLMMLKLAGVDLDQVNIIYHNNSNPNSPSRPQYLIDRIADGTMFPITPETMVPYEKNGVAVHRVDFESPSIPFYQNVIVTSGDYLDQNSETVRGFHRAMLRGWLYAITHSNETIERYRRLNPNANPSLAVERALSAFARIGGTFAYGDSIGGMSKERWNGIADAYVKLGMAEKMIALDRFIYNPNPTSVWPLRIAWGVFGVVVLVSIVASVLLIFNRRLTQVVEERTAELTEKITESVAAERRQKVLMAELDHRVKNNLAIILSLAEETLESSDTLHSFGETFSGRVRAMAHTHEMLAKAKWENVDLERMIEGLMSPYQNEAGDRLSCQGNSVMLHPEAASPLSFALYELCTNAAKYGALSNTTGRLAVHWQCDENQMLTVDWTEMDGPRISAPPKAGTGTNILIGLIEFQMRGKVTLNYLPEGLAVQFHIPLG